MEELLLKFYDESLPLFEVQQSAMNEVEKYELLLLVNQLTIIPFKKYIQVLNSFSDIDRRIEPSDIVQFSKFDDTNINLSKTLVLAGNSGFTWEEVGSYLLRNVNSKNNRVSNTKYGENHLKTGKLLGLSISVKGKWYLTKLGCIFSELTEEQQARLLSRLSLKTKLIAAVIYDALRKDINISDYINVLSDSTKLRRRSNIKKMFKLIRNNGEYKVDYIFDSIDGGGFV